jgi:hypothetical protein
MDQRGNSDEAKRLLVEIGANDNYKRARREATKRYSFWVESSQDHVEALSEGQ